MLLGKLTVKQLRQICKYYNLHIKLIGYSKMKKQDIINGLNMHLEFVLCKWRTNFET